MSRKFLAGSYDSRTFIPEDCFSGKAPFDSNVDIYTLEEVLKLQFVEGVKDWYETDGINVLGYDKEEFKQLTEEEKTIAILRWMEDDEYAGVLYFESEEDADLYKREILQEIAEIEAKTEYAYVGKGCDVYKLIDEKA